MAPNDNDKTSLPSQPHTTPPDLRFLHYNDVYHIEPGSAEPVGGIARFQTVVNEYKSSQYVEQPTLLTLFSGDAYNPSIESSVTKGRHMVPFLNAIGTNVACVGNHDLDFGIAQFIHLRKSCKFPWLLANVLDPALGDGVPLANCEKAKILTSNGIKVGVIGLAEREWLETINSLPPNLIYKSASETAEELVPDLRAQGCEIIIALTHMREPNDIKLAQKTSKGLIDLILGGHDHYYSYELINSTHVLRSGTDFRQLSYIEAWRKDSKWEFNINRRDIVKSIQEDPETVKRIEKLTSSLNDKLEKPIGYTAAPLDARFTSVRLKETNLGNFVCDLMRHYYDADCALCAGGTFRGDQVYPPGVLRMKDIMNCFPFEDPVVVLRVKGQALLEALENCVCLFPALEGRFSQVSNIAFEFNPKLPPGSRVLWVKVGGQPLHKSKLYKLATRGYMGRGKDGFDSLLVKSAGGEVDELVSEENGIIMSTMLRQYFLSMKILGRWRRMVSLHDHWHQVGCKLHENHRVKDSVAVVDASKFKKRKRNHDDSDSILIRDRALVAFDHGGKVKNLDDSIDHAEGEDMIDSDSDGSVILENPAPRTNDHPLISDQSKNEVMSHSDSDRLYHLARRYGKLWMELAGVERHAVGLVDEHEVEHIPSWTRGIAPRIEGAHEERNPFQPFFEEYLPSNQSAGKPDLLQGSPEDADSGMDYKKCKFALSEVAIDEDSLY